MRDYVIITDSTTDLPVSFVEENGIVVIPMRFTIGDKEYQNFLDGREMTNEEFYSREREGELAKTAQLTIPDIVEVYEPYLKQGYDILGVGFSSGLSGTFNAMRLAREELLEKYPDSKILLVDSLCASLGEGLFVYYANKYKHEGKTIDENMDALLELRPHLSHWFTVESLETLRRGGRVSNIKAFLAGILNLIPILHVDDDGHLVAMEKKRGRNGSLKGLIKRVEDSITRNVPQMIMIGHGDCLEDANFVANEIKKLAENNPDIIIEDILINCIGPVIGAHSGPGTLAIFFIGKER